MTKPQEETTYTEQKSLQTILEQLNEAKEEKIRNVISNPKMYNDYFDSSFYDITKKIIGQDDILAKIKKKLFTSLWAMTNRKQERPRSFVFLGNSTTGKTETARRIGEIMCSDYCLIPMSNFTSDHEKSMIVGSSAGYAGYGDKTIIEKYVEKNGTGRYCFIFDEIEKAPKSIYSFLLNFLDTGTFTLLNGNVLDLQNSIVIFTGNLGATKKLKKIGFLNDNEDAGSVEAISEDTVVGALKEFMSFEIMNRVGTDNVYVFNDLTESHKEEIMKRYLEDQINYLEIKVAKSKKTKILGLIKDKSKLSVRELKTIIQDEIILDKFYDKK